VVIQFFQLLPQQVAVEQVMTKEQVNQVVQVVGD
jgi:hypothetical protein